jgi:hypothetical protein
MLQQQNDKHKQNAQQILGTGPDQHPLQQYRHQDFPGHKESVECVPEDLEVQSVHQAVQDP